MKKKKKSVKRHEKLPLGKKKKPRSRRIATRRDGGSRAASKTSSTQEGEKDYERESCKGGGLLSKVGDPTLGKGGGRGNKKKKKKKKTQVFPSMRWAVYRGKRKTEKKGAKHPDKTSKRSFKRKKV